MPVKITGVEKGTPCAKKGIVPGDELLTVNGREINDYLDYNFYGSEPPFVVSWKNSRGKIKSKKLKDCTAATCGLQFETYLMDRQHSCRNKCIFCFVDQMPPGMRKSLYFKDDDARLSFLFGNYITLTNLSRRDVDRIKEMHISPLNVSVHTMNPQLRVKMMKNPNAGECLSLLREFSDAGIKINAQLVLCPGINDGEELYYSLEKLSELESLGSVAAVPVGLTRYREGLSEIKSYDEQSSAAVISVIDEFNRSYKEKTGRTDNIAFASDEFYLNAGIPFPEYSYYGDFPQLDNGVGLWTLTTREFEDELADYSASDGRCRVAVATGLLAYPLICGLADSFMKKYPGAEIDVFGIKNDFFGEKITVAGLVTGEDLIRQLKSRGFDSPVLFLPSVMFKSPDEKIFLDDVTVEDAEKALDTKIEILQSGGVSLAEAFYSAVNGGKYV